MMMITNILLTLCLLALTVSARPQQFAASDPVSNQMNSAEAEVIELPSGPNGGGGGGGQQTNDLNAELQRLLDNWADSRNLLMMAKSQAMMKRNRAFRQCYFNPISCFKKK